MKNLINMLLVMLLVIGMGGVAFAFEAPEIDGEFMYLPLAKVMTIGAGVVLADFSKDDSANSPTVATLPQKLLYSSSLKASVAWNISGDSERTGLLPDYGGLKASIDVMKLLKNIGANVNTDVALTVDGGLLADITKLFDKPAVLQLEPAIGVSVSIKF